MKIRHSIEFVLFQLVAGIVLLLPLRAVQKLGGALGVFVYSVLGFRRGVTLENLRHAFPEKSNDELNRIAQDAFRNVGTALLELVWVPRLVPERIRKVVSFENTELVKEVCSRGKGVLLLTAHFGNWELLAQSVKVFFDIPLNIIVKTQSNSLIDRKVNERRTRQGSKIVPMDLAVREVLRALRAGEAVGIVADQSAAKENIAVEFFGRNVPTHEGPAVFSLKTGAPILLLFSIRKPDGTYRVMVEELPTSDLVGYNKENVVVLTKRHVKRTEEIIRAHPDHWMWMHKRWKHVQQQEQLSESAAVG